MFLEAQVQAIADYMGQTLELTAFFVGLVFILVLFVLIAYTMYAIAKQALSVPMDLFLFALGIAVVTFLGWWSPWILIAMVFLAIFALVFLREGSPGFALPSRR